MTSLVVLLLGATRGALAAGADEAESSFSAAIHAYDRHAYQEALDGFQHAYELKPSYKILYNIGLSEVALGDSARALDAFEGYLAGGVPTARATEMTGILEKLRAKVGEFVIDDAYAKASLSIDGRALPANAGTRPLHVNPGEHRVCAALPDRAQRCQVASAAAGGRVALDFPEPAAAAESQPSALHEAPAAPPPAHDNTARWVAWSTTGAFAAGAAVTGVLALAAHSDERDAEKTRGITRGELDQAQSKTQHLALATDLLFAGAAVSAGVALYLQLSSSHEAGETPRSSALLVVKPTGVDFALHF